MGFTLWDTNTTASADSSNFRKENFPPTAHLLFQIDSKEGISCDRLMFMIWGLQAEHTEIHNASLA